jgi:hypothetical protein
MLLALNHIISVARIVIFSTGRAAVHPIIHGEMMLLHLFTLLL